MPTLRITDKAGLTIEPQVERNFSFREYFGDLTSFSLANLRFQDVLNPPLSELPLDALDFGATFNDDIEISKGNLALTIEAGVSGGFLVATSKDAELQDSDRYGSAIEIPQGSGYLGFFVRGQGGVGIERGLGNANFGFGLGASFRLSSHRKVPESDRFVDSLRASLESFSIVAGWRDIESLPADVVAIAEGEGSLRVSLGAEIAATPNPLLSVGLPVGDAKLQLTAGGKIGVQSTFTVSGDYQVRVRRLAGSRVELGYYKGKGKNFEFHVEAVAGAGAGVGQFDFLGRVLGAISPNAKADRKALADGGLNDAQIQRIEDILKEGIQRKVQVSLDAAFGASESAGEALLFEIDTARADEAARKAVVRALHGDLSVLTASKVAGVKLLRSVFHQVEERTHVLRLNLLGIYNHITVGALLSKSRMVVDSNGDITILDQVIAERAGISMTQFGADEEKLRKLLMETFLVSAAYHAGDAGFAPPSLRVEHVYFELHSKTNYQALKDNFDVAAALDLLDAIEKRRLLGTPPKEFGRSTLFAAAGYEADLAQKLFLDGNKPRAAAYYEAAGREAVLRLFEPGDENDYVRLFADNAAVWKQMKQEGFPQFARIYRDNGFALNGVQVEFLTSYAVAVIEWAKAMAGVSGALGEWREWKAKSQAAGGASKPFQEKREEFLKRLREAAQRTKAKWSEPWGLVAMYLALKAADRKAAGTQVRIHSRGLKWVGQRNPATLPDGTPLVES